MRKLELNKYALEYNKISLNIRSLIFSLGVYGNIGMSECHKNVDNYYGSNITVWIPCCAGREAFDGVEPLPELVTRSYLT